MRLRRSSEADLRFVLGAEAAPENCPFILPWPAHQHRAAFSDQDLAHLICETVPRLDTIGFVIIAGLTNPHRSVEFKRIVITAKRRGYRHEAVRLVKRLAFDEWNAHRLWLDVKVDNERARRMYESEGFKVEGILRECLKTAEGYKSLAIMSILRSEYTGS